MQTRILTHLLFIVMLLGTAHAEQARYHVFAAGNNMNPGTEVDPFGTIQKAVDLAQPGDLIWSTSATVEMNSPTNARSLLWLLNSMADSSCRSRTRC
ncbi:MAG: hypothetical protein FJ398_19400 [Verrucomicrobia bacterium]|nr:hypothetical protein [Verrucomicrobiota bacterium]